MRAAFVILGLVFFSQCSHSPLPAVATSSKVEWYISAKEPVLTYCPKGASVPVHQGGQSSGEEFVYLADQRTRYYIPSHGYTLHRQQAIQLKQASISASETLLDKTGHFTFKAVRKCFEFTVLFILAVGSAGPGFT